jgi:hypothetical protein
MQFVMNFGILRQSVSVLTLAAAVTTGSTCMAAGTTVLFEQPTESGIFNHIYVAHVSKGGMPHGSFDMIFEQPDPFTSTGNLVANSWDAGSQTGFTPNDPSTAQLAFRSTAGSSTAQMEGGVVGAYLNSKDLPTTLNNRLFMIAPQYRYPVGTEPVPFGSSGQVLNGELDLQIPMAVGKDTYMSADFLFLDAKGTRISFGFKIFQNGVSGHTAFGSLYDVPEKVYIINSPLAPGQQFVSLAPGSTMAGGATWTGWRHFQWSINQAQFAAALKYLVQKYPGRITSTDPTAYVFSEVHLNAEFMYSPAPAELGWSMKGMKVWITG